MPDYKVTGPKGGVLIRRASQHRLTHALPALVARFKKVTVSPAEVDARVTAGLVMRMLLQFERKVHYAQLRPMRTASIADVAALAKALQEPSGIKLDCSESATLICRLAGIPDPNGLGYNGTGFTGTIMRHLRRLPGAKQALVGDLVVFGLYPGHHVCTVLEAGADPLLFSHGQERGPITIRLSAEAAYQPKPAAFYRVAV